MDVTREKKLLESLDYLTGMASSSLHSSQIEMEVKNEHCFEPDFRKYVSQPIVVKNNGTQYINLALGKNNYSSTGT